MYDGAIPAGGQSRHMQSSLAHIASADAVHPAIPLRSKKTRMILAGRWRRWSVCEKTLLVVFLLSLPLCNPWLRGDGIGYYAYARALLIDQISVLRKTTSRGMPISSRGAWTRQGGSNQSSTREPDTSKITSRLGRRFSGRRSW